VIETVPLPESSNPLLVPPEPVHNCASCSLWLPEGTLACPECNTVVYQQHLRRLGSLATQLETEQKLPEARAAFVAMLEWLPPGDSLASNITQHIAAIDARAAAAEKRKADWTRRLGPLAPVLFFLAKIKTYLFLILKFKFLLSFFAFFGLYWIAFGWRFALGFTFSIAIHEFGHYFAAKRRGLKVDLPVFLPGLGAYVRWYSMGVTPDALSAIALAGPAAGLLAAGVCAGIYLTQGGRPGPQEVQGISNLWGALAHAGAWVNLINLIPVFGLDGDQATRALDRTQRGLLLATTIVCYAILHEGVFLFIAAGMTWRLFSGDAPQKPSTPTMVRYTLLLFLLGGLMWIVPDVGRQF
jgi:Zn-dependent protease